MEHVPLSAERARSAGYGNCRARRERGRKVEDSTAVSSELQSCEGYRSGAPHEVGRREREGLFETSKKREVPGDPVKKEAREGFREQVSDDTFARRIESF